MRISMKRLDFGHREQESDASLTASPGHHKSLEEYNYNQTVEKFHVFAPYPSVNSRWIYWEAHSIVSSLSCAETYSLF